MQIAYVYSSSAVRPVFTSVFLGDDAIKEFITGYRPEAAVEIQKSAPPRSDWKQGFARGLAEMEVSWNVARSLADYATNCAFVHNHMIELLANRAGKLFVNQDGITSASWNWRNARLQNVKVIELKGAWSMINYQFWCSELTTSST